MRLCESFQMSRKGWRTSDCRRGHMEWKERKRRTYWIDQRVPTTLLPYFLPTSPYWCNLSPNSPIENKEISNDRTIPMKADRRFWFVSQARLLQRLYYRSESDVPYWPAEEHPYKRMNGKQALSILRELCLLYPPRTHSSILIFAFRL